MKGKIRLVTSAGTQQGNNKRHHKTPENTQDINKNDTEMTGPWHEHHNSHFATRSFSLSVLVGTKTWNLFLSCNWQKELRKKENALDVTFSGKLDLSLEGLPKKKKKPVGAAPFLAEQLHFDCLVALFHCCRCYQGKNNNSDNNNTPCNVLVSHPWAHYCDLIVELKGSRILHLDTLFV